MKQSMKMQVIVWPLYVRYAVEEGAIQKKGQEIAFLKYAIMTVHPK